jgi:hypothetical protein
MPRYTIDFRPVRLPIQGMEEEQAASDSGTYGVFSLSKVRAADPTTGKPKAMSGAMSGQRTISAPGPGVRKADS